MEKDEYMYSKPRINIIYYLNRGLVKSGNFDKVPANAVGAGILQFFPIITLDGEISQTVHTSELWVGERVSVDNVNNIGNPYNAKKFVKVAFPEGESLNQLSENSTVYASNAEMAKAIALIKSKYDVLQNSNKREKEAKDLEPSR